MTTIQLTRKWEFFGIYFWRQAPALPHPKLRLRISAYVHGIIRDKLGIRLSLPFCVDNTYRKAKQTICKLSRPTRPFVSSITCRPKTLAKYYEH